jgi:hypothetical protein
MPELPANMVQKYYIAILLTHKAHSIGGDCLKTPLVPIFHSLTFSCSAISVSVIDSANIEATFFPSMFFNFESIIIIIIIMHALAQFMQYIYSWQEEAICFLCHTNKTKVLFFYTKLTSGPFGVLSVYHDKLNLVDICLSVSCMQ